VLTKGFSQTEVESRLKALANTLDTRGWAIKNIDAGNTYTARNRYGQGQPQSDRLLDIGAAAPEVPSYDAQASDDILDATSSPVARQFQSMIDQSARQHRQHIMDEMNQSGTGAAPTPAASQSSASWFTTPPTGTAPAAAGTAVPVPPPQLPHAQSTQPLAYSHMRTLQPAGSHQVSASQTPPPSAVPTAAANNRAQSGVTPTDPAILSLANNNDLNVSTIARQANKAKHGEEPPQDEVVVSLR
jgi:hypothetical protein